MRKLLYLRRLLPSISPIPMPSGMKLESETVVVYNEEFEATQPLSENEQRLLDLLSSDKEQCVTQLQRAIGLKNVLPVVKRLLEKEAMSFFGSGWTFLVVNADGEMKVMSLSNGDTPLRYGMTPLLAIDLWEHAYYLDYQNRRKDYLANLWLIINWRVVSSRMA